MYYIIIAGQLVSAEKISERKHFSREAEWLMSWNREIIRKDGTTKYVQRMASWLPKSEVIYQGNK